MSISLAGSPAHAASGTWTNLGADNNWQTASNWTAGVPGATSGFASTDSATFSTAGSGTINLGDQVNIQNITLGVGTGNSGAFTIGDLDDTLNLTAGAIVTVGTGVTSSQQLGVSGTIINLANGGVAQSYSLINNSATGAAKLNVVGDITGNNTAAVTTITLNGSNGGTISGVIGDGGGGGTVALTKNGLGTWTLTGANAYSGATQISGGTLDLGGGTANGSIFGGSVLTLGNSGTIFGGTLTYTRTGTHTQAFNGTTIAAGASTITVPVSTAKITLGALTHQFGGTVDFSGVGTITTSTANANGILGGWATFGGTTWAVANTAANPITGYNSFTASTAGTTAPGTTANVDFQASNSTAWNTQSINSLRFNTAAATTLTLASGQTVTNTAGGILVTSAVGNNVTIISGGSLQSTAADLNLIQNNTSNELVINSVLSGTNGVVKAGAGSVTLNGANTYTGRTYLTAGTLKLGSSTALGSSASTAAVSTAVGTTLDLNGVNYAVGGARTINILGGVTNSSGTAATFAYGWNGTSGTNGALNTIDGTGDITFSGAINGGRLVKNGNTTLTLTNSANNASTTLVANSGTTILNSSIVDGALRGNDANGNVLTVNTGGLVKLGANNQILSSVANSTGIVSVYGGTFDMNGKTETVSGLQIGSTDGSTAGSVTSTGGISTLTVTGSTTAFGTDRILATNGTASVVLAGSTTTLTKNTSGTVTLSGANTYGAGTTISAGTLLANTATSGNSATGTGAVSVASTGTLGGTGQIRPTGTNGITVASGGFLAPGTTGTGTLTIDSGGSTATNILSVASGASLKFDLGAGGGTFASPGVSDLLVIANSAIGDVAFNSNVIDLPGSGAIGTYKLFDGLTSATDTTDSWTGLTLGGASGREIMSGLTVTNLSSGLTETLILGDGLTLGAAGDIYLVVVPEPTTIGSMILGLAFLIGIHRLRRQQI